ncbi:SDR family NAD(P)-dependent oxidoreductase [Clostridium akagii]|uniref:SDR family NAD(P)-dependent oxidoreductase n=1 Tax=Clostridium akagii TaxID=91623 RepID=UPI00047D5714|nr:SDR family NAD(P)-dependent oxidoreductase [Clostridium akagii]
MKKVLITGAAGGLGLVTTKYMVANGWRVYATYNRHGLEKIKEKNIIPIQVDITNNESVNNAVMEVFKTTDTLDAVVNFAGIMVMGSVIESDVEMMRKILDINLLGMYRINQAFFEMIQKGNGRYVNVSSEFGALSAVPFNGFYTASKHAVEIYSDSLRRELMFLGIDVIKIRPGAFKTNMQGGTNAVFDKMLSETTHYKTIMGKMRILMEKGTGMAKEPIILAKQVYRALTDEKPKLVYSTNLNKSQKLLSCLPERIQDRIFKNTFR